MTITIYTSHEGVLEKADLRFVLNVIAETLEIYPYATPSIFSGIVRCAIVSVLYGRGIHRNELEGKCVKVFTQVNIYAHENPEFGWFVDWSKRLARMVENQRMGDWEGE